MTRFRSHSARSVPPGPTALVYWGRRGGGARYTLELTRAMVHAASGATPVTVSIQRSNELLDSFVTLEEEGRIALDVRSFGLLGNGWTGLVPGPWSFGAWCARHRLKVIITMGNPVALPLALILRLSRIPFMIVVHDAVPHPGDRSALMHRSVRSAARFAAHVVVPSHSVRAQVLDFWRSPPERVSVIPLGPFYEDEMREKPVGRQTRQGPPTVLFVGRIVAYKGLALLLQAWPAVTDRTPNARLLIAGAGSLEPYRPTLRDLGAVECDDSSRLVKPSAVHVVNRWLDDRELLDLVRGADVVVLPYVEASQSGLVGIAQSVGAQVVCTNVGGLPEQVGPDAIVVDATPTALADGLTRALSRPYDFVPHTTMLPWAAIEARFQALWAVDASSSEGRADLP